MNKQKKFDPAKARDADNKAHIESLADTMKREGEKERKAPAMPQVKRGYPEKRKP
jgi:hypothetical protein